MDNYLEQVETLAELFYRETGMMAPGKSEPLEWIGSHSHEERRTRYDAWYRDRALNCALDEIARLRAELENHD